MLTQPQFNNHAMNRCRICQAYSRCIVVGSYRYTSFSIMIVSLRTIGQRVQVVQTVSQRQVGNCLRVDAKIPGSCLD